MSGPGKPAGESAEPPESPLFPPPIRLLDAGPQDPLQPLAAGFLLESTISCFTGEDEAYKSTAAVATAVAVAGGLPAFGTFATQRPRRVLIVSEEDEFTVTQNRAEAMIAGMGWEPRRQLILGNIHVHALDGLLLDDLASQAHLLQLQQSLDIELMIFDPLADLVRGEENSATAARPVKRLWRQLVAQGCAVLVVAHYGKPAEGKSDRDRMRGTSAYKSAMRTIYALKHSDDGIEVTCLKMSRTRRPEPFRIDLEILTEEGNAAMWREARLTVAGKSGDWRMKDRRTLSPSDRKALGALDGFREEALSWTRWVEVSGLIPSTLANVRRRLIDLRYVDQIEVGTDRFKKKQYRYSITGEGTAALISPPDSETPIETPTRLQVEAHSPDYETPPPPLGGSVCRSPDEGEIEAPDSNRDHLESVEEPGDAWEAVER